MWDENSDLALAIQLQNEFNEQANSFENVAGHKKQGKPQTLVDPSWELIDPNPDARVLFLEYNDRFFWGRLAGVEVRWSPRMTLCAGVCVYEGRGGLCSVRLSLPLLKLRPRKDLVETLLHEMIHAYLFVTDNNKDHDGHGPEFHKHMYRINADAGTNISVYHTFHDEVDNYRQHWWKCDGPCQKRPPYFGFVKRAMNRVPSARDPWWADHQRNCGGNYVKVKEPDGYGQKKTKKKGEGTLKSKAEAMGKTTDIRNMFSGNNHKSPSSNTGKPNLPKLQSAKSSNIAGFVKGKDTSELQVYKDNSPAGGQQNFTNPFSGKGKTMATSSNWKESSSGQTQIVRKLPGIGIIETKRPLLNVRESSGKDTKAESDDDDILIYSPGRKHLSTVKNSNSDIRSWVNKDREKASSVINLSDSDGEFDQLLSKAKKYKKKSNSFEHSSPPNTKKLVSPEMKNRKTKVSPGFNSVCNKKSSESAKSKDNKVYAIRQETNGSLSKGASYTSQRNKRAHDLGSSSSDSDFDALEKASLLSVIKKKRKKSLVSEDEVIAKKKSSLNSQNNAASLFGERILASTLPETSFVPSGSENTTLKSEKPSQKSGNSVFGDVTSKSVQSKKTFAPSGSKNLLISRPKSEKSNSKSANSFSSNDSPDCMGLKRSFIPSGSNNLSTSSLKSEKRNSKSINSFSSNDSPNCIKPTKSSTPSGSKTSPSSGPMLKKPSTKSKHPFCDDSPECVQPPRFFKPLSSKFSSDSGEKPNAVLQSFKTNTVFEGRSTGTQSSKNNSNSGSIHEKLTSSPETVKLVPCPVCNTRINATKMNEHLDLCLS